MGSSGAPRGGANPFTMPKDEDMFTLREEEKARAAESRAMALEAKAWEKGLAVERPSFRQIAAELEEAAGTTAQRGGDATAVANQASADAKLSLVAAATRGTPGSTPAASLGMAASPEPLPHAPVRA